MFDPLRKTQKNLRGRGGGGGCHPPFTNKDQYQGRKYFIIITIFIHTRLINISHNKKYVYFHQYNIRKTY